jgi:uncharacterized protein (TIGR02217 family)
MAFHDIRFPVDISLGAEGGPRRRTQIVTLGSGHEERNSPWAGSRRRFNAGFGVKSLEEIESIIAFFEARQGRLHSFRWRDPFDWKSCSIAQTPAATDQMIATGDGSADSFALIKTYMSGAQAYQRTIRYPVLTSLLVAVDGNTLGQSTDYSFDETTGNLVFAAPPAQGAVITAGYEFDIAVRFDTDELSISMTTLKAGDIPSIPVIEVLS